MKTKYLISLVVIGLATVAGCGKKGETSAPPPYEASGIKVDLPKLQQAFATAEPELAAPVNDAVSGFRYGQYEKAMMALDKLVNNPKLTEDQKKLVNEVIEQVKQVVTKAGPTR